MAFSRKSTCHKSASNVIKAEINQHHVNFL